MSLPTTLTPSTTEAPDRDVAAGGTVLARVDELLGRRVSMRSLALLRILIGPVVLLHLRPFVDDALDGHIYRDSFYEPYASWYPELPRALYSGLLYLGAVAAVALSLGLATRVASVVTFGVVAYNLFLSTTHVHNNRAFLVIVLAGLAMAPCGRELSVDAWWRHRRGRPSLDPRAPGWPLWLLRFEASVLYGASGLSKLLDPDWFGGTVNWQRTTQHRADLEASPLPGWVVDLLLERGFHTFAAKGIVLTELAIAAGLWSRRTRYAAVWLAVCFHVSIQLTASVEVFSYLAIAALVIWAVPSPGDRILAVDRSRPSQRRLTTAVAALDWLARFRTIDHPTPSAPSVRAVADLAHAVERPAPSLPSSGRAPQHLAPSGLHGSDDDRAGGAVAGPAPSLSSGLAGGVDDHDGRAVAGPASALDGDAMPGIGGAVASASAGGAADGVGGAVVPASAGDAVPGVGGAVVPASAGGAGGGAVRGPVVTDRDGSVLTGRPAMAFVLSRLPLTAWFALPTLLLPAVRRARIAGPTPPAAPASSAGVEAAGDRLGPEMSAGQAASSDPGQVAAAPDTLTTGGSAMSAAGGAGSASSVGSAGQPTAAPASVDAGEAAEDAAGSGDEDGKGIAVDPAAGGPVGAGPVSGEIVDVDGAAAADGVGADRAVVEEAGVERAGVEGVGADRAVVE